MPIIDIKEELNPDIKLTKPIKEKMDKYIKDIPEGVSRRNGMIYLLIGSGGSGKTSLLLNFFRKNQAYHRKFHNLYLYTPSISFSSVQNHPFENHDKVYHELNQQSLEELNDELISIKEANDEDDEIEYNCVIIDDFASSLKEKDVQKMLNKMLIKARHLNTCFIFCLQSFFFMPKILRKQTTYATIFKPKNKEEFITINTELLQMKEEDAKKIFDYAFKEEYSHLDIDTVEDKIYRNFNPLTIIKNDNY
jgi:AAA+ ATPase superfamily predicted ATPase